MRASNKTIRLLRSVLVLAVMGGGCSSGGVQDEEGADGGGDLNSEANAPRGGGGSANPQPAAAGGSTGSSVPPASSTGGAPSAGAASASDDEAKAPGVPGDRFEQVGTNPFVYAAYDPLSTFAADVDTASYDLLRRDINNGVLPSPDSVRLEEYVNNFVYDYAEVPLEAEHPFAIQLAAAPTLFADDTLVLRVGIQSKLPPPAEKKPANLVFLVDVSGSMQGPDRLPLVQQVLGETVGLLDPTDTISIVTYAGSTGIRLRPTPASDASAIHRAIAGLSAGGSTAGAAGLDLAYEQAVAGFIDDGINHVVLCTDGDFNMGPSSNDALLSIIREKRKTGVTLTALGFGSGNLNDSMMEAVSNAGNGIYGVISSASQASDYVTTKMLSTLVHVAKDMKIQVEFNPQQVVAYRLLGYENRAIADVDFRDDVVDAGEVGASHRVTALYQIVPVGVAVPAPRGAPPAEDGALYDGAIEIETEELVRVKVRYKQTDATESDAALEVSEGLLASDVAADESALDTDFQWALGVASFAEILKQSPYADAEQLDTIQAIIHRPVHLKRADRAELATLFVKARALGLGR